MFSRVSQLARHLSRPLPNYAHTSAAGTFTTRVMTSSAADERSTRTIHTAACLIIGDEVLGGKVSCVEYLWLEELRLSVLLDCRCKVSGGYITKELHELTNAFRPIRHTWQSSVSHWEW